MKTIKFAPSKIQEKKYKKILNSFVNNIFKIAREELLKEKITFKDDATADVKNVMRDILRKTYDPQAVEAQITSYFTALFVAIDRRLQRSLEQTLLSSSSELLSLIISQNVQLVTTLHTDALKDLEVILNDGTTEGRSNKYISERIREIQNKSKFRAETIAITETAKASSQLNRKRFKDLGITKAKWSTAHDDRVRQCHKARDGKEYDLSKGLYSSCDNRTLQVGEDFRCRCAMLIVI